jgi:hypothetical protein
MRRSWAVTEPRKEGGYPLNDRVQVPGPRLVVDAGQDFELGAGDMPGQVPRLGNWNEFVRPVQHQDRYAQAFEQPLGAAIGQRAPRPGRVARRRRGDHPSMMRQHPNTGTPRGACHSVETELVALDVLHHEARLVVAIGRQ